MVKMITFALIVSIVLLGAFGFNLEQGGPDNAAVYFQLQQKTKLLKYGKCWTDALEQLKQDCRSFDDEVLRRIGYAFARCHLLSSGREMPVCAESTPMSECANEKVLSDVIFTIYTQYTNHAQQICYHLQHQIWLDATEAQIGRLVHSSNEVTEKLVESSEVTREIAEKQTSSLHNQKEMMEMGKILHNNLQDSQRRIQGIMKEHSEYFEDFFERISTLQKTVIGEFTNSSSVLFNIAAMFVAFFLTTFVSSASARMPLFAIITFNFVMERFLVSYLSTNSWMNLVFDLCLGSSLSSEESLYRRIWFCRRLTCVISFLSVVISVLRYKDYNRVNNEVLLELMKRTQAIHEEIRSMKTFGYELEQSVLIQRLKAIDASAADQQQRISNLLPNGQISLPISTTSEQMEDGTYYPDSDSNSTTSSTSSNYSYVSTMVDNGDDEDDVITARIRTFRRSMTPERSSSRSSSTMTTPSRNNPRILERLGVTPDREMSPLPNVKGKVVGGYNLRRRRTTVNYFSPNSLKSIQETETVEEFIRKFE